MHTPALLTLITSCFDYLATLIDTSCVPRVRPCCSCSRRAADYGTSRKSPSHSAGSPRSLTSDSALRSAKRVARSSRCIVSRVILAGCLSLALFVARKARRRRLVLVLRMPLHRIRDGPAPDKDGRRQRDGGNALLAAEQAPSARPRHIHRISVFLSLARCLRRS
jgi:hypothetical protein